MKKIFILHGWTYSLGKWELFAKRMKAAGITPIFLPIPGLTEDTDTVWTLEDYVEWLRKKLENEKKPILVGHSNGGRIALAFAAAYPQAVGELFLIASAGIYHNEPRVRFKRLVFGAAAKFGKKITSSEMLRRLLYALAGESDYKNAAPQMRQTMSNLISVDLTPRLALVAAPTFILWGKRDTTTPFSDGQLMHKLIKNSRMFAIEGAGHSPQYTHAEKVCDAILQEIKKYESV